MEETRKRNEASMARKRANQKAINPAAANAVNGTDSPLSPSSTGAMDSLLEKLRAAAPQARDQRDRRRRARLKDKHQVRVASGQAMPDLNDRIQPSEEDGSDKGMLSPDANGDERMDPISESEDVAERAANMLRDLGGDAKEGRPGSRDGSLKVRRKRDSAIEERAMRRRRRGRESTSASGGGNDEETNGRQSREGDTIPEDEEGDSTIVEDRDEEMELPKTVVSPPSPEPPGRRREADD